MILMHINKGKGDELSVRHISPIVGDKIQTVSTPNINNGIEKLVSERELANKPHSSCFIGCA